MNREAQKLAVFLRDARVRVWPGPHSYHAIAITIWSGAGDRRFARGRCARTLT